MLVNLHHVEANNLRLVGELAVKELELEQVDELIHAGQPLQYDLETQKLADAILVQGRLQITLDCECVRCLKSFKYNLELNHWARHLPLKGEDKVLVASDCVDLTPYVREDILLELPRHPLCKPECSGLLRKATNQKKKNGGRATEEVSSAWAELNKLKL